jgi:hypothetical protein
MHSGNWFCRLDRHHHPAVTIFARGAWGIPVGMHPLATHEANKQALAFVAQEKLKVDAGDKKLCNA